MTAKFTTSISSTLKTFRRAIIRLSVATALSLITASFVIAPGAWGSTQPVKKETGWVRIFTVFDNYAVVPGLQTGWGFASVVTTPNATILFDTGANGAVLLANMRRMKLNPQAVQAVVISHAHGDHLGGLKGFLTENSNATAHIPASFPDSVRQMIHAAGAEHKNVTDAGEIVSGIYTTGLLGNGLEEQALVVDASDGLIIITGCAHPGIVRIVKAAHEQRPDRPIALVMGGFHLRSAGRSKVTRIIQAFRRFGVKQVAPSHCTGDAARRQFQKAYGDDYIAGGLGRVIELP